MPELYIMIARKYFFRFFYWGGDVPSSPPVSYAHGFVITRDQRSVSATRQVDYLVTSYDDCRTELLNYVSPRK